MILEGIIGDKRPISWVLQFWPVPLWSFLCAFGGTWLCKKIALKFGIVDRPDNLVKTHKKPIAYLGGVGILIGFTMGIIIGLYCIEGQPDFREAFRWLLGILAGALTACFVGVIDDIFVLTPGKKFLGQIAAAVFLIIVGIKPSLKYFFSVLGCPESGSLEIVIGMGIVVFFVLGATNSLNLLDGLDGLCAGVTGIITVAMFLLAAHLATWDFSTVGDPVRVIVCLSLMGGVFGFLPFNRHPARIFMGDAGSMLLGFVAAAIMILFGEKIPRWWMASIIVFGLPILDTATALARRFLNHRPLFVSDRGHLYDQLMDRGMSLEKAVKVCYMLAAVYAATGLLMSQIRTWYALWVYILVMLVSAFVIWQRGFLKMEGFRGCVPDKK